MVSVSSGTGVSVGLADGLAARVGEAAEGTVAVGGAGDSNVGAVRQAVRKYSRPSRRIGRSWNERLVFSLYMIGTISTSRLDL